MTCTPKTNSAASRMYSPATLASTTVRYSAACTMFFVVTTRIAPMAMAAASAPNAICWATISRARQPMVLCRVAWQYRRQRDTKAPWGSLLGALLDLGAGLERRRLGHGEHPLVQP